MYEFSLDPEGESPGLEMQLRDGLLIGLLREGIDVIDSTDVAKQLASSPELAAVRDLTLPQATGRAAWPSASSCG